MSQDSPLSIAASLTGILTFVAAVIAGFYAHGARLANAIDRQAEVSRALEKIDFLETETSMLTNAFIASQIRQPDRKYGSGDFKYFQMLYKGSLDRMQRLDRDLRVGMDAVVGDDGEGYGKMARVRSAAAWVKEREGIRRDLEERLQESARIFQIQLAMLSAKVDELSYHQNHHNLTCNVVVTGIEKLKSELNTVSPVSETRAGTRFQ